jgi:hypothetical protein
MMAKAKKIKVDPDADNTKAKVAATIACEPTFKAALTAQLYAPALGQELDTVAMHSKTAELAYNAKNDGLGEIEVMMAAQIYALDSIFHYTAGRAKANMGQYPHAADMYMRLALKAQTQCRSTAETLSAIKNPRAYIRQTNIAQNQQINNSENFTDQTNELLSEQNHATLDFGGKSASGRTNSTLAALEAINGGEGRGRQKC